MTPDTFMQAIILTGGLGTRLRSITGESPKALIDIAGKPFIDYQIEYLKSQAVTGLFFSLGYKAEKLVDYLQRKNSAINFEIESEPLGTGGAVKFAIESFQKQLNENFFVLNGDSLIDTDLETIRDFHNKTGALVTMGLIEVSDARRYGSVEVLDNNITAFREKGCSGEGLINSGIYVFNKKAADYFPDKKRFSLEYDFFPKLTGRGLSGIKVKHNYFIDVGTPESYRNIVQRIKEKGHWLAKEYIGVNS